MKNNQSKAGITALELLAITFIVLRLTNVISWSWLWVLSPIWIPAAIVVICIILLKIL